MIPLWIKGIQLIARTQTIDWKQYQLLPSYTLLYQYILSESTMIKHMQVQLPQLSQN